MRATIGHGLFLCSAAVLSWDNRVSGQCVEERTFPCAYLLCICQQQRWIGSVFGADFRIRQRKEALIGSVLLRTTNTSKRRCKMCLAVHALLGQRKVARRMVDISVYWQCIETDACLLSQCVSSHPFSVVS